MIDLGALDLPLAPRLAEVLERLESDPCLVLKAEPGAGKTSLAPIALAFGSTVLPASGEAGAGGGAPRPTRGWPRVLVLEPRRIAAVQAAWRAAELLGEAPGRSVGWRVRGDSRPGSAIEFVTEGVFVRMIQEDPGLEGVRAVVFDEFHERSLNADLGLALILESRAALRPDLRLLLMSATFAAGDLAGFIGGGSLEVEGRCFPVRTVHRAVGEGPRFEEDMARTAFDVFGEIEADLLVFLPGMREIERTSRALAELARGRRPSSGGPEVLALHGSLPLEAQRGIINPGPGAGRRIILATSVAETSLTVPRIAAVLDCGFARLSRFESRSGLNRLVTEREAEDRAEQRRGRAGRLGPGLCVRAWPASETLPERTPPEILRAELSGLVLEAAVWGARRPEDLRWLDPPPASAWDAAVELLAELGAMDMCGKATDFGRACARMGTEPRLAAMVLRASRAGRLEDAAAAAAMLGEGGPIGRDLEEAVVLLHGGAAEYARLKPEARRLASAARKAAADAEPARTGAKSGDGGPAAPPSMGGLLAEGFPDRVAKRLERVSAGLGGNGDEAVFQLPGGRKLRARGGLAASAWIVAADADAGGQAGRGNEMGRVLAGAELTEDEALEALGRMICDETVLIWDGLVPKARARRRAGSILLAERPLGKVPPERIAEALATRIASEGLGILPWEEGRAKGLLARMRWYGRVSRAEGWPELTDESLAAAAASWLGPFVAGGGPAVTAAGLAHAVAALVPAGMRRAFERDAPERMELPSGSSRELDYASAAKGPGGEEGGPLLEARPQELYGLSVHPRVLGRPVLVRLLSPAQRPIHTTSDLPAFWRGAWAEVRKDLRGRYPRHDWPVDPSTARPGVRGIARKGGS
jgi:ATP-dependent helicase HrpB